MFANLEQTFIFVQDFDTKSILKHRFYIGWMGLSKKAFFTENIGMKYSILVELFHEMATF